jgi:acetylornithine deacetylase
MGRVLSRLESHDRELQARQSHAVLGVPSLHASLIDGGRELSTYPDRCVLQLERRTVTGETARTALDEIEELLASLRSEDPEFEATARLMFHRPSYETPSGDRLPDVLESALKSVGRGSTRSGMTYWTDAAVLGQAGIPSVIFGPGGAGYHGLEEYVRLDEVLACRDVLAELARSFCAPA